MSTSDQNGGAPLTRKQMRELRLTGSTPVIEEASVAPAAPVTTVLPRAAEPVPLPPAPVPDAAVDLAAAPLTRRQMRDQERIRTASVPVIASVQPVAAQVPATIAAGGAPVAPAPIAPVPVAPIREPMPELVSDVPLFPVAETSAASARTAYAGDRDALAAMFDAPAAAAPVAPAPVEPAPVEEYAPAPVEVYVEQAAPVQTPVAEQAPAPQAAPAENVRPQVNPDFGRAVAEQASDIPAFSGTFDDIVGDSAGSQHSAPSALIYTQPTEASLSGPVASTGEVLVTGTYDLPRGLGSQGHAGTADGKEVDVVLIDGELPPTSSPTPIAASAAVSTSKPAGEVIRPPAPEKGNRLMMTLAIVAGGLALLLGAALVIAFSTNVFG
ncbi:hypothetical protein DY023_13865 [Microbacterium bovistercoris]|uniref:Uncharacterized protein n=1 Tax=Microbacterium bovistercoris TaxID=2293570 RepID=A0A371NRZ5_9MICO|nr:hypothetical protein [Microbacterium bovistercoris]REJ04527.1 hypothetical protein DY023_13865 [Microbacterium bovistercoris]